MAKFIISICFVLSIVKSEKSVPLSEVLDQTLCTCDKLTVQPRILDASLVGDDDLRWLASIYSVDDQEPDSGNDWILKILK